MKGGDTVLNQKKTIARIEKPSKTVSTSKPMRGMSLNAIRRRMKRRYKTSRELLALSNLLNNVENREAIRSGLTVFYEGKKKRIEIKPDKPPSFITYEMLLKEGLEEDDVGEHTEPTKKEQGKLRIKWWKAWYKIITGYYSVEKTEQLGGGFDFEKARTYLINKIKKTTGIITDQDIRRLAEESIQYRNVKLLKPVKTTRAAQKKRVINDDAMDTDKFNDPTILTKARRLTEAGVRKARIATIKDERVVYKKRLGYIRDLVNDELVKAQISEARRQYPLQPTHTPVTVPVTVPSPVRVRTPVPAPVPAPVRTPVPSPVPSPVRVRTPVPSPVPAPVPSPVRTRPVFQAPTRPVRVASLPSRPERERVAPAPVQPARPARPVRVASLPVRRKSLPVWSASSPVKSLPSPAPAKPVYPVSMAIPTTQEIDANLIGIKKQVLRDADNRNRQYMETPKDRIIDSFDIANSTAKARRKIRSAYLQKLIFDNLPDYSGEPRAMSYTNGNVGLFKLNDTLHLYGMQLPPQFDRIALLHSMLYLIESKRIYSIVDLHDCANTNVGHPYLEDSVGCNPFDMSCSEDVYNKVMDAIKPAMPHRYHRIVNYFDMSPGFPSAWDKISKIESTGDENNSVAVHCLAGKGRTGSVLIYLYLRDRMSSLELRRRLMEPHFGYRDISELIYELNELVYNDVSTSVYSGYKRRSSREILRIGHEVSMCGLTSSILLRQRLNRIFFYLARGKGMIRFYSYGRPSRRSEGDSPEYEFNFPMERRVDWGVDWSAYDSDRFD